MTFFPCDANANATAVDCSTRPFSEVPSFHCKTVTWLDLSQTKIRKVNQHSFVGVPNLLTLKIIGNCQPTHLRPFVFYSCKLEIHNDAFKSLLKLENLYLSGNSLSVLPWLPESLKLLDVQDNHIFYIEHLKAPNLEVLYLTRNCFYANPCNQSFYMSEQAFKELPKLKNISLGYNNLTAVPKGLPMSLEYLDLKENTIPEIFDETFANLPHLNHLNLEWNCQRCDHAARPCFPCPNNHSLYLHPKSLYCKNSSITYLSLRGNSLKTFPKGLFEPLKKLKYLDLSDNLLAIDIQNGSFFSELKGVLWMSLVYNYKPLQTFSELNLSPYISNISGLNTLRLSGFFFQTLSKETYAILSKLHHLSKLDLSMNFISTSNMSALSKLPSIINIDLSQNMLKFLHLCPEKQNILSHEYSELPFMQNNREVPSVGDPSEHDQLNEFDILKDSKPQILALVDFKKEFCQYNLTFNLSYNDIVYLDQEVLKGMENAVCVDLSFNYMSQTIKKGIFSNMRNLTYLDLSYNRFDLYYNDALSELRNTLEVLDLSNNDFHFNLKGMGHHFQFLQGLSKLVVLSLANNRIGMRISKNLISSSLKYLYFNGNHLKIMWESDNYNYYSFFQNLTNLIYLDISDNNLISISPVVLCNFPASLQVLRISRNELKYFPWQNLSTLHHLQYLDLSQNHINYLPPAVEFGVNFTNLDLSQNQIASIPDLFFTNGHFLQYLYLSSNRIKEFNQELLPAPFKNGSTLRKLTLHSNLFRCDCDTAWFADFLSTTPIEIPYLTTKVLCEFPESQQGKSILNLAQQRSCQDIYGSLAFLVSCFLTVMLTILPLLKHLYSWDLWYCLQVLWAGYKGYSQLAGSDSNYHYDAFVLFDTKNQAVRDWVYSELTFHLENMGHKRFCLCLEERDWIPGLSCIENLHNAVYKSVKTVFVLSSGGETANGVMRQAFFMVQQRLLDEKVDATVLVLLDDMFPKLKYLQLRKRLCRKSVLSWPKNPKAQPLFWNQLRMALSLDNLKFYDSNMTESFM